MFQFIERESIAQKRGFVKPFGWFFVYIWLILAYFCYYGFVLGRKYVILPYYYLYTYMETRGELANLTDEQLIVHILDDRQIFAYIVERYQDKLMRFIRRISGVSREQAEDLLQEIFLKAYQNLNSFDTDLKFSSWIYRIARNHVISHHRKVVRRPEVLLKEETANKLASDLEIEHEVDAGIEAERINQVLSDMKPKYREILILKFLEEKDYNEISDILKIPLGTIATRIHRAKQAYKKAYEKRFN